MRTRTRKGENLKKTGKKLFLKRRYFGLPRNPDNTVNFDVNWDTEARREDIRGYYVTRFYDQIGMYRVSILEDKNRLDTVHYCAEFSCRDDKTNKISWWSVENSQFGPGYPRYYDTLEDAVEAVHHHNCSSSAIEKSKPKDVNIFLAAKELGLWSGDKMIAPKMKKRVISNGHTNGPSKPSPKKGKIKLKKETPAQAAPKGKTPAKRASGRDMDKWGLVVGTPASQAMKVLSKKPKSMSEIMEESGLPKEAYNTTFMGINKVVRSGLIEKVGRAYKVK